MSKGQVDFRSARFERSLSLFQAKLSSLRFSEDTSRFPITLGEAQFRGAIDARGLTYDRISVVWSEFFEKLEPFDRQPFGRLEAALRSAGRDRDAEDVYLAQRGRLRRELQKQDRWRFYWEQLYWIVARCGVRPYQLFLYALFFVAVGCVVFSRPDALVLKTPPSNPPNQAPTSSTMDAVGVSVSEFVPLPGDFALGGNWKANDKRIDVGQDNVVATLAGGKTIAMTYAMYATIERVTGWILVPLGVAAVAGLLYRRPRA